MQSVTKAWTKHELTVWLENLISTEMQLPLDQVRQIKRFDALGVDSLLAAYIAAELKDRLGRPVDIDTVYEHGDVYTLADKIGV